MRLRACVAMGLSVVACGGSASERPPAGAPAAKAEAARPIAAGARSASDELRRHWTFADEPQFVLYGDLAGFAKTELVSGLAPALLALGQDAMSDVQRGCARSLIGAVRELAVGSIEGGHLFLLRFDDGAIKPGPAACLRSVSTGQPTEIAGATVAYANEEEAVALQPGLAAFGSKKLVVEALKGGAGRWPAGLDLAPDTHLSWRARVPAEQVSASGTLASSHDFFRVEVKADLGTEPAAAMIESKIAQGRNELTARMSADPNGRAAIPLFDALRVERSGRTLSFALDLKEPPADQARDVGMLAAIGISGLRKYLIATKLAEARATLASIARSEVDSWRDLPAAKRKLASLPPVPKEVPHGMKYQSAPVDWQRWEALKFSLQSPQYFQYEVVASKDGKHAEIVARGDLDGDGKSSELKLNITVSPKGSALEVAPSIEEKDPEE